MIFYTYISQKWENRDLSEKIGTLNGQKGPGTHLGAVHLSFKTKASSKGLVKLKSR